MVRERGSGITPERVTDELKKAVDAKSQLEVSKQTGIGQAAINRYIKGIGEPTTATLQKLADYLGVTVSWLRGSTSGPLDKLLDELRKRGVDESTFNLKMDLHNLDFNDFWMELIKGTLPQHMIELACERFDIPITSIWENYFDIEKEIDKILGVDTDLHRNNQINYILQAIKYATENELQELASLSGKIIENHLGGNK